MRIIWYHLDKEAEKESIVPGSHTRFTEQPLQNLANFPSKPRSGLVNSHKGFGQFKPIKNHEVDVIFNYITGCTKVENPLYLLDITSLTRTWLQMRRIPDDQKL